MKIGVLGDLHLSFDARDVELLDAMDYAVILFVGDIAGYAHHRGLRVARRVARLETPAIVIPGNHDAAHLGQMAAEVLEADALARLMNLGQRRRALAFEEALAPAIVAGYSRHRIERDGETLDVIAGRPHSTGGPRLAFRSHLELTFGVRDLEGSARRLIGLVEQSDADHLVFLSHNGPSGLGETREDIWGCDFRAAEGDFGDPDLAAAVAHARRVGKPVRAVVAGHMHHALRGGGTRRWRLEDGGVSYVNAARVPRIFTRGARILRHHVELVVDTKGVRVREVLSS